MINESLNLNESHSTPELNFEYSVENEISRVRNVLGRYDWYKENGYEIMLPKLILEKLKNKEEILDNDITNAVSSEFDGIKYKEKILQIENEWGNQKEKFFENLRMLGLPIQSQYHIVFTIYGTGGSYYTPDTIVVNLGRGKSIHMTICHEIVHLTIESLIRKYKIDHWTKERLVNLITNKFFPEKQIIQRDPKNAEKISEIFEKHFPNIEDILVEINS